MTDCIINPWFIYAIGITDSCGKAAGIIGATLTVAHLFAFGTIWCSVTDNQRAPKDKPSPWWLAFPMFTFITMWTVIMLIPNSKTLIGMAVASQVTEARVVKAGKVVYAAKDDLKKDILDIILAIKDTKKGNTKPIQPKKEEAEDDGGE